MRAIKKINAYKKKPTGRRLAAGSSLAILALALGLGGMTARADDIPVTIIFEGPCPKTVSDNEPVLEKARRDRIVWTAQLADGTPMTEGYSIYFDPFVGRPFKDSDGNGVLESPPLNDGDNKATPPGVYKYTVLGKNCPDYPLDPNIRVR